jgi:RNA ligase
MDDLVLLAVLTNDTQEESSILRDLWVEKGGIAATEYDFKRFEDVLEVQAEDAEGFVVKFDNGIRVKVKFDEYLRLHRLLTNTTSRTIWENLRNHVQMQDMLEVIPDEFYQWVTQVEDDLLTQYRAIEEEAENMVCACAAMGWIPNNRKAIAQHFEPSPVRGIMFSMIDGKEYEDTIWKMIKPKADKPFRVENNDETTCSDECPS